MGKLMPDKNTKQSPTVPKPTAADEESYILNHIEVAFILVSVGTILLVGLIWCCCKREGGCKRRQRLDRARSVSVIHITNNTTSNCAVLVERPPSYADAMTTPECPPPPYPGFETETNVTTSCDQRTPPPAYCNFAFRNLGDEIILSTPVLGGVRRCGLNSQLATSQENGAENEAFIDHVSNNNNVIPDEIDANSTPEGVNGSLQNNDYITTVSESSSSPEYVTVLANDLASPEDVSILGTMVDAGQYSTGETDVRLDVEENVSVGETDPMVVVIRPRLTNSPNTMTAPRP